MEKRGSWFLRLRKYDLFFFKIKHTYHNYELNHYNYYLCGTFGKEVREKAFNEKRFMFCLGGKQYVKRGI